MHLALVAFGLCLVPEFTGGSRTARAQGPAPGVVVAEYDGIIHPIAAEFVEDLLRCRQPRAEAAVLMLRTPGGLLESTRTIVSRMLASRAPVVVFVAPAGSRAASAGFIITFAADVAAMAPGTHIGAAHPVSAAGSRPTRRCDGEKAAADTAAYVRTLAEARKRNVALAAEAVTKAAPSPSRRRSRPTRRSSTWRPPISTSCSGNSTAGRSRASTGARSRCDTRGWPSSGWR